MSRPTYLWRQLTPKQRQDLLAWRKRAKLPWHHPPHRVSEKTRYHVTTACFEHRPFIGLNEARIQCFCETLLGVFQGRSALTHAWCVLPNHYHALLQTKDILGVLADLGRMHGRLSFQWNGEDCARERQV